MTDKARKKLSRKCGIKKRKKESLYMSCIHAVELKTFTMPLEQIWP